VHKQLSKFSANVNSPLPRELLPLGKMSVAGVLSPDGVVFPHKNNISPQRKRAKKYFSAEILSKKSNKWGSF